MKNLGSLTWLISGRARGGRARLIGTAAGLAVGTMLLLLVVAAYQGMTDRSTRAAQFSQLGYGVTNSANHKQTDPATLLKEIEAGSRPTPKEIITASIGPEGGNERFRNQSITRVDVAVGKHSNVRLAGLAGMPKPGEYYASPALAKLISQVPDDELGARYGTQAGLISPEGLAGPDVLVAVVGHDAATLARSGGASITDITKIVIRPFPNANYEIIAIVGGIAVLFPVVVLIVIVTRLGQAARSDRIRTLGLMGATPTRISTMSALETALVGVGGTLAGIALYWISLPLVAQLSLEGSRFYTADLVLHPTAIASVVVTLIATTTLAAFISAMRSLRTAAGTGRDQAEPRPRLWRLVPLVLGIVIFTGTAFASHLLGNWPDEQTPPESLQLVMKFANFTIIPSFLLIAIGLVLAGPLLLSWIGRAAARKARTAAGVLALGRLFRHPTATFRTVSGLVVALFVVTVFAVGLTTDRTEATGPLAPSTSPNRVDTRVFLALLPAPELRNDPHPDALSTSAVSATAVKSSSERIKGIEGVKGAYTLFENPTELNSNGYRLSLSASDARELGLEVPSGAHVVTVNADYFDTFPEVAPPVSVEPSVETPSPYSQPATMVIKTDNTESAIERVRTALIGDPLFDTLTMGAPRTMHEGMSSGGRLSWAQQYAGLANIGIAIAALISVVSLAVSTIAGVIERRRALALLRLTGMPAKKLRSMITIETAVPFASVFLLCVGLGVFVAWALVTTLNPNRTVTWPDPGYYIAVGFCLAFAALAIIATFRTARRTTAITETRFE